VKKPTSLSATSRGKSATAGANGRALGKTSGQAQSKQRVTKKPATTSRSGNASSGRAGTATKPKPVRQSPARGDRPAKKTPPASANANSGSSNGKSGK
jgi:hypothetical protein